MAIINRSIYFIALVVVAAIYTVTLPPESLTLVSLVKALIPATSVSVLFVLAKGVLGEGLTTHAAALILVVVVITLVSIGLTSTGLVSGARTVANVVGTVSNATNATLGSILP